MPNKKWIVDLEPLIVKLKPAHYDILLLAGELYQYLNDATLRIIKEGKMLNFKEVTNGKKNVI